MAFPTCPLRRWGGKHRIHLPRLNSFGTWSASGWTRHTHFSDTRRPTAACTAQEGVDVRQSHPEGRILTQTCPQLSGKEVLTNGQQSTDSTCAGRINDPTVGDADGSPREGICRAPSLPLLLGPGSSVGFAPPVIRTQLVAKLAMNYAG
jgi:hypothetical protein